MPDINDPPRPAAPRRPILAVGEVLFDELPGGRRLGGAPLNFAYHLLRLGWPVHLVTRVGRDADGRAIRERLQVAGFDAQTIQIDPDHPTGTVSVQLDGSGVPTFAIHTDVAYDYLELDAAVQALLAGRPALIYFGTLVQRTAGAHRTIQSILQRRPAATRSFCDLNLRPRSYDRNIIAASLEQADILKLGDDELDTIAALFDLGGDAHGRVGRLMRRFELGLVAVTRGAAGSSIYTQDGGRTDAGPAAVEGLRDTVGAGDAYAAVLAAGVLGQWPLDGLLAAATDFAARICTIDGAVPTNGAFYDGIRSRIEEIKHG